MNWDANLVMWHIKSLDMETEEEYFKWCTKNGFACKLDKSRSQRKSEQKLHRDIKFGASLKKQTKKHKDLTVNLETKNPSDDMLEFFAFLKKKTKLLDSKAPECNRRTFTFALENVWRRKNPWIRDYRDFKPKSKNIRKQFSQLLRHLYTEYEVPEFMNQAWFQSMHNSLEIDWFVEMCQGKNIRKCSYIRTPLNKRQAHFFVQAPSYYSITDAFHYGQIMGIGGTQRLVEQVMNKLPFESFWDPLIRIFINNPMLDPHLFGQLVDYVRSEKDGTDAPNPNFSFKGRTAESLLKQSEEWHRRIRKTQGKNFHSWEPLEGIISFRKEEGQQGKTSYRVWAINELLNSKALALEGGRMSHCVRSYTTSCKAGRSSIWTLECDKYRTGMTGHVTIEVDPKTDRIVQMKGRGNRPPTQQEIGIIDQWASKNRLTIGRSY